MYFIYDNISSEEFGIKIKKGGINNFSSPQRSYETIQPLTPLFAVRGGAGCICRSCRQHLYQAKRPCLQRARRRALSWQRAKYLRGSDQTPRQKDRFLHRKRKHPCDLQLGLQQLDTA